MSIKDDPARWPRISVVTAVYNGEAYLEDAILSVISQRYPNLEYIIIDSNSSDGTPAVIEKYRDHFSLILTSPKDGVYNALNRAFSQSTGEILGWLNASDKLHTGGLCVVGSVFASLPTVEWLTGRPTSFDPTGMTVAISSPPRWSRGRFLSGANRYIQQESTFWRRGLFDRAGPTLSTEYGSAGDFELWTRFFRHTRLYSVDALIGGYRYHQDALSSSGRESYNQNSEEIIRREIAILPRWSALRNFAATSRTIRSIPKVRGVWRRIVTNSLYTMPGPDLAPRVRFVGKWVID